MSENWGKNGYKIYNIKDLFNISASAKWSSTTGRGWTNDPITIQPTLCSFAKK
jgi:hypothetical protein